MDFTNTARAPDHYAGLSGNVQALAPRERSLGEAQETLASHVSRARAHAARLEGIVGHLTGEGSKGDNREATCVSPSGLIAQFDRLNEDLAAQLVRIEVAQTRIGRLLLSPAVGGEGERG